MLSILFRTLVSAFQIQRRLALENLTLSQQIAVLHTPFSRLFY